MGYSRSHCSCGGELFEIRALIFYQGVLRVLNEIELSAFRQIQQKVPCQQELVLYVPQIKAPSHERGEALTEKLLWLQASLGELLEDSANEALQNSAVLALKEAPVVRAVHFAEFVELEVR